MKVKRLLVSVFIMIAVLFGVMNMGGMSAKAENNNTVVIWAWGSYAVAATEAANIYTNAVNPYAQIDVVHFNNPAEMMNAFNAASAAGVGPDIMIMRDSSISSYYAKDAILPCGVHYSSEPAALYYNQRIMDEAGVSIGSNLTWDEYRDIGHALKNNNPDMYLFQYDSTVMQTLLFSGNVRDLPLTKLEAVTMLKQFNDEDLIYKGSYQDTIEKLRYGRLASVIGGPWLVPTIAEIAIEQDQEWRVAKIPKSDKFSKDVYLGGYSWVISSYSRNIAGAVDFLKNTFQTDAYLTTKMAEETLIVPVLDLMYTLNPQPNFCGPNGEHVIEFLFNILGRRRAAFCILGGNPTGIGFGHEEGGGFDVEYIYFPAGMFDFLDELMNEVFDGNITPEEALERFLEWLRENDFYDYLS